MQSFFRQIFNHFLTQHVHGMLIFNPRVFQRVHGVLILQNLFVGNTFCCICPILMDSNHNVAIFIRAIDVSIYTLQSL